MRSAGEEVGRRRVGRWRRRLLALPVSAAVAFGLSNLWLASPSGRGWLGRSMARATGLQVGMGLPSWSPWRGLTLRRLTLAAGTDGAGLRFAEIDRVVVVPRWRELLHGRAQPASIEMQGPRIDLPVELLVALAGGGDGAGRPAEAAPLPSIAPDGKPADGAGPETPGPPDGSTTPSHDRQTDAAPQPPPMWLSVRGGGLRLGAGKDSRDWIVLDGIDADVPLRGVAADGSLRVAGCMVGGRRAGAVEVPLHWRPPVLSSVDWRPGMFGLRAAARAEVVLAGSCPFALACAIPEQSLAPAGNAAGPAVAVGRLAGIARMVGHVRMPSSWQGDLAVDFENLDLAGVPVGPHHFDTGVLRGRLSGGVLRIAEARAIGEAISLLGNGVLRGDGQLAAVLRFVVPESTATALTSRLAPLRGDDGGLFQPLETRDRWFVDCRFEGSLDQARVRLDGSPPVPVEELRSILREEQPGER